MPPNPTETPAPPVLWKTKSGFVLNETDLRVLYFCGNGLVKKGETQDKYSLDELNMIITHHHKVAPTPEETDSLLVSDELKPLIAILEDANRLKQKFPNLVRDLESKSKMTMANWKDLIDRMYQLPSEQLDS